MSGGLRRAPRLFLGVLALRRPQGGHERPHLGPVRDAEVQQATRHIVARRPLVGIDERFSQVGRAEMLEVHDQEREVVDHVDVAELVVELDAVQHPWPVVEQEDVVGQQVAMAVADPSVRDPVVEEHLATRQEAIGEHQGPREHRRVEARAADRPHLDLIAQPPIRDRIAPGGGVDLGRAVGGPVEAGEQVGELVDRRADPRIGGRDQLGQPTISRHPAHDHEVIAERAVGTEHVRDALVHVRGQSTVELDLPDAQGLTCLPRRKVGEGKPHRLLQLVRVVPEEQHDGHVGLDQRCIHPASIFAPIPEGMGPTNAHGRRAVPSTTRQ
jgi:hypothetical protein